MKGIKIKDLIHSHKLKFKIYQGITTKDLTWLLIGPIGPSSHETQKMGTIKMLMLAYDDDMLYFADHHHRLVGPIHHFQRGGPLIHFVHYDFHFWELSHKIKSDCKFNIIGSSVRILWPYLASSIKLQKESLLGLLLGNDLKNQSALMKWKCLITIWFPSFPPNPIILRRN